MLGTLTIVFRTIFRNDLIGGLFFILLSYVPLATGWSPAPGVASLIIGAAFPLGGLMIGNYITVKLGGFSLISRIRHSSQNNQSFTLMALAGGAILQFLIGDLAGIWYYPQWSLSTYLLIGFVVGGWVFYFLFLIVCYEAAKLILDKYFLPKKEVTRYFKHEGLIYKLLLCVGVISLCAIAYQAVVNTDWFTKFHFSVGQAHHPYITWYMGALSFVGIVSICEYVEYKRKRSSLVKDTIHGYLNPLIAGIVASLVLAWTYEIQNYGVLLWKYANYPWPDQYVFGVPLFVVLAWPLHVLGLVVFWRAFGNGSSSVVFANAKSLSKRRQLKRKKLGFNAA
ncbi:MAG TPA: hypothetical protein VFW90_00855 [Candidatus Saccharimonadales bacterium]|nr:hypothetical protein [Candidatus Saccharimonadales bacterium]